MCVHAGMVIAEREDKVVTTRHRAGLGRSVGQVHDRAASAGDSVEGACPLSRGEAPAGGALEDGAVPAKSVRR